MDMEDATFILTEALGGEKKAPVVRNALGHLSDEDLEALYRAWRLLGLCLGDEFDRRSTLEEATWIAATT